MLCVNGRGWGVLVNFQKKSLNASKGREKKGSHRIVVSSKLTMRWVLVSIDGALTTFILDVLLECDPATISGNTNCAHALICDDF